MWLASAALRASRAFQALASLSDGRRAPPQPTDHAPNRRTGDVAENQFTFISPMANLPFGFVAQWPSSFLDSLPSWLTSLIISFSQGALPPFGLLSSIAHLQKNMNIPKSMFPLPRHHHHHHHHRHRCHLHQNNPSTPNSTPGGQRDATSVSLEPASQAPSAHKRSLAWCAPR